MKERTRKIGKAIAWLIGICIVLGTFLWYFSIIKTKEGWLFIDKGFVTHGRLETVYIDTLQDLVVYEIVAGNYWGDDIYVDFPEKKFNETNINPGYQLYVVSSSGWLVAYLFNHSLIDIQPNKKLDNGDILIIYNASKYAGKNITLHGWTARSETDLSNRKSTMICIDLICTGVIPHMDENSSNLQHRAMKQCSCWEWFVKEMEDIWGVIHFDEDARERYYRPWASYDPPPIDINYQFSSYAYNSTHWAERFVDICEKAPPNIVVLPWLGDP